MCGITGIYNYPTKQPIDTSLLIKMSRSIQHRGTDDEGIYIDQESGIGLGHRRLSIIDLSTGNQPMSNAAKNIWIVFNGEIYNFPELKRDLIKKGYEFRTASDTEVIIHMYEEFGDKAFAKLNGIFAFAIYDSRNRWVFLVRDHFGVKPLYYTFTNGKLLFGSEIKSVLQDSTVKKELDYEAFHSFLTFRYNPSPQTLFKNVKKLNPGHYLKITYDGNMELKSYFNSLPETNLDITEEEAINEYQKLLENAVKRQVISDVPVGLLLSGGIDSAAIGYFMRLTNGEKIKTFTIGFEGKGDYNELDDARKSANYLGTEHYDLSISKKTYLDFFLKSFYYTEEPIAQTTIPALYYVSKLASTQLKVVLAGQGADEPLAGYQRYIGEYYISKYSNILKWFPLKTIVNFLPRNERFKRAVFVSQFSSELERFLGIYTVFTPEQKEYLLNREIKKYLLNVDQALFEKSYFQSSKLKDSLSKILYMDTRMHLPDNLLLFGDKMTMANSLEMRVPFLDIELVSFLESLPSSLKLKRSTGKYIHKKAMEKVLPKEIITRKKRPFATPMDEWLQKDLAQSAKKLFNDRDSVCKKFFNIDFVNKIIDEHQKRKENYQRHIFTLLSFEIWYQHFFEDKEVSSEIFNYH